MRQMDWYIFFWEFSFRIWLIFTLMWDDMCKNCQRLCSSTSLCVFFFLWIPKILPHWKENSNYMTNCISKINIGNLKFNLMFNASAAHQFTDLCQFYYKNLTLYLAFGFRGKSSRTNRQFSTTNVREVRNKLDLENILWLIILCVIFLCVLTGNHSFLFYFI